MKIMKNYLVVLMMICMLAIPMQLYAYGSQVDSANAITMPESLSKGKGNVSTSLSGAMSYQFVEITSSKYNTIRKYEAICDLITAYMKGSSSYDSLASSYESTYNQTANGIMTEYEIQFNKEGYNAIRGLWVSELTSYNESAWKSTEGHSIAIDLNTFKGTKYYIAWVKIGDTYDAEVYKVTGTKSEEEKTNKDTESDKKEDKTVKEPDSSKKTSSKDTTMAKSKKLPQTGLNGIIVLTLMLIFIITGSVSYIKYNK